MPKARVAPRRKRRRIRASVLVTGFAVIALASIIAIWGIAYNQKTAEAQRVADEQYAYEEALLASNFFYPGITVDGIDIGGMTREAALAHIDALHLKKADFVNQQVIYGDKTWTFDVDDMPVIYETDSILDQAYELGRHGSRELRLAEIEKLGSEGRSFTIPYRISTAAMNDKLYAVADEISYPAQPAYISHFDPSASEIADMFTVEKPVDGLDANYDKLVADVMREVENETFNPVTVETTVTHSDVTPESLLDGITLITKYTTYTDGGTNRDNNIRLASESFNGRIIMPGETFSINESTGPRTVATGYLPAGSIVNGVLVQEPGGGVCQVSGTLYNAVLRADLQIVERYHHTWPSTYVPYGLDATINYDGADFRFKNNKSRPIFLATTFKDSALTVYIYGPALPDGIKISARSEIIETIEQPPSKVTVRNDMEPGSKVVKIKGRQGYKVDVYIDYYDSEGNLLRSEKIYQDYYKEVAEQIEQGPEPTPAPTPTPPPPPPDDGDGGNDDDGENEETGFIGSVWYISA